jgi:hypothetical protein
MPPKKAAAKKAATTKKAAEPKPNVAAKRATTAREATAESESSEEASPAPAPKKAAIKKTPVSLRLNLPPKQVPESLITLTGSDYESKESCCCTTPT